MALALTGLLLALVGNFLIGSTRAVSVADVRNEALNDVTLTQQLVGSKVRQAWWVAPPGSTLDMAAVIGSANPPQTRNPATNQGLWMVPSGATTAAGSNQVLLAILPPGSSPQLIPAQNSQYQLYAYYPVQRDVLITGYSVGNAERPMDDPANANSWVIMQFLVLLGDTPPAIPEGPVNLNGLLTFGARGVSPLMEYQRPLGTGQPLLFRYHMNNTNPNQVQAVTLNLQVSRTMRGQELQQPGAPLALTVYPRNLGR